MSHRRDIGQKAGAADVVDGLGQGQSPSAAVRLSAFDGGLAQVLEVLAVCG